MNNCILFFFKQVNPCKASVIQQTVFSRSVQTPHNHPAEVGAALAASITTNVKARVVADIFRPASDIVEEVLLEDMEESPARAYRGPSI